jgi:hypothetical protein
MGNGYGVEGDEVGAIEKEDFLVEESAEFWEAFFVHKSGEYTPIDRLVFGEPKDPKGGPKFPNISIRQEYAQASLNLWELREKRSAFGANEMRLGSSTSIRPFWNPRIPREAQSSQIFRLDKSMHKLL